jgi:hypothetical protein
MKKLSLLVLASMAISVSSLWAQSFKTYPSQFETIISPFGPRDPRTQRTPLWPAQDPCSIQG